jgi:serine/threonine protein kinase
MLRDASSAFSGTGSGQKLEAGLQIDGRYRLEEFLGRGGMGTVWRATDETLELPVALKFLHEILIRDDAALEDLKRETKRALQLTHPNIVRVHSLVEDSALSLACIAMEFVPGVNLTQRRVREPTRRFEVEGLARWTIQLCDALQYAHEKAHIVHRDLKPGNLLLDVDDDLKITDFGIAASANESITRLTGGTSGGTLEYMSPQQAQGDRPTARDDLYALGATLYELLTGEPPFGFQPPYQAVLTQIPPTLRERRRELGQADVPIPDQWEQTIAALLSKMAEHRPQSARDVLKALGLEPAGGHAKVENFDDESLVRTETSPGNHRKSSVREAAVVSPPADEEEYDDSGAATVVPRHSRAADDPALATAIPILRPSGTFPPKPPEAPAPAAPQASAVIAPTPASSQPAVDQRQKRLVIILAVLLAAAVGVIVYFLVK